jgi:hypothetical protein
MAQSATLDTDGVVTPDEARSIAKEAYVYGVPMVSIYGTLYAFSVDKGGREYKGPFNTVLNVARVFTPDDTAFVTPNSDTPYTFMGPDLRAEPMVITVPPIEEDRYFVFQLMDLYTFNFDYIGTRATGNGGGDFLLVGPDWKGEAPSGITKVIPCETEMVNVVGRTQLFDPGDLDNVKAIQAGYRLRPLSAFLDQPAPPPAPELNWVKPVPPAELRTSLDFFNVLSFVLQLAPTHPSEIELRARFAKIGVVPGRSFDAAALSPEIQDALKAGMADGQEEIDARRASLGGKSDQLFGTRAFLNNDYVTRAVGTQVGIGANSREEALYPIYEADADGQPLDGAAANYRLRFAPGAFPPVKAFWSLTMYDKQTQLLVANPIDRYLINSPMLPDLKLDPDGGLTIRIQRERPTGDAAANWLPTPNGPFMLAMRYYLPKPELLSGTWTSPRVERFG